MRTIREISDPAELDRLFVLSEDRPVWLFKHSSTCGVSSTALWQFRDFVESLPASEPGVYATIGVHSARAVSNLLAASSGVRHESPQVLLLREGRVVWHASHWRITRESLEEARDSCPPRSA